MSTEASTGEAAAEGSTGEAFAWNDGWRNQMALGSTDLEKDLKQLERYESPEQVWRKARELEAKFSSGDVRTRLPDEPSDKELAQWRKDNAVPATPADYAVNMPEGRDKPPDDDAFLKAMLESMHNSNATQAQVDATISTFYQQVDMNIEAGTEADQKTGAATEDLLRKDWGEDYRVNKSIAEANLSRAPEGFRDRFLSGRMEDGTLNRNDPDIWKWLVQNEREINPMASIVPGAQGDGGKAAADELIELKALMANDRSEYYKGPKAEGHQARYRELIEGQRQVKEKAGTG